MCAAVAGAPNAGYPLIGQRDTANTPGGLPLSAIFISHSSRDNDAASMLRAALEAAGYRSVFLDFHPEDGIPAGRNWETELYVNLRACQAVVVLCSDHSMTSKWCFAEITH